MFIPHLSLFDAPIRGPSRNIAIRFGMEKVKTRMMWLYLIVKKV